MCPASANHTISPPKVVLARIAPRKFFQSKIFPISSLNAKIWRKIPANVMIPQDRGGEGGIPENGSARCARKPLTVLFRS